MVSCALGRQHPVFSISAAGQGPRAESVTTWLGVAPPAHRHGRVDLTVDGVDLVAGDGRVLEELGTAGRTRRVSRM
jgi:hypothetical protein